MAIPDSFLEELADRCDLVDIASGYTSLKRKSGRYWGCCPFHNEKTPSFSIVQEEQRYYCFGCHRGGGVINFVMEAENLPFREAVQLLADRAGLTVPADDSRGSSGGAGRRKRLLELNREAARWYHAQLYDPAGAPMLNYLRGRGLSKRTVTGFGLGAAPAGWDNLIRAMGEKGFDKAELLEAGLAAKNEKGRIYDRFRDRVMFPIIDLRGDVIAFGGRVLDDATPKYLNSPDTPVFNKRKNLFALNIAKKSKQGRIILTEGYMDTISLHQYGFDCAVASLGTALTEDHAKLISRYAKEVVISYDGDEAGISAAQRAITILEKEDLTVRVLQVTGAKDPDEYLKKYGAQGFEHLIEQSGNHIEYRLRRLQGQYDLTGDEGKVAYLQAAAELVAALDSPVEREVYGTRAAEAAGFSAAAMTQEVERARTQRNRRARKQEQRASMNPVRTRQPEERSLRYENLRSASAEETVILLVERDPALFQQAEGQLEPEDFSAPFLGKIYGLFRTRWRNGKAADPTLLAGELSPEEMNRLMTLLQRPVSQSNGERALADCINIIKTEQLKRAGDNSDAALLAYRNKKQTEDQTNEREKNRPSGRGTAQNTAGAHE